MSTPGNVGFFLHVPMMMTEIFSDFQIFYSYSLFTEIITFTVLQKLHPLKREKKNNNT